MAPPAIVLKLYVRCSIFMLRMRWKLLGFYYEGLAVQARFLYRQSPLFKYRHQELGLQFAMDAFETSPDDGVHFFHLAQKEPLLIRFHIFWDALAGRELHPYYIGKEP